MELDIEEKIIIVKQHLNGILKAEYQTNLNIDLALSVEKPNQSLLDEYNNTLKNVIAQKNFLKNELEKLKSEKNNGI